MTQIIILIFLAGYLCIALEAVTRVGKPCVALLMSVLCWSLLMWEGGPNATEGVFMGHLSDTCQTVLFLLGAMAVVQIVDSHGGFAAAVGGLHTCNARKLLVVTVFATFFMSAVLDNMTTSIVMVMMLRRLVPNPQQRMLFAGMVIVAANSGGAFSPIGDVTTIMLWIKGCVSTLGIIRMVLLPSLVTVLVPLLLILPLVDRKLKPCPGRMPDVVSESGGEPVVGLTRGYSLSILTLGVLGLMLVPVFRMTTGLPPFVGMLGVLAVVWIYAEWHVRCRVEVPEVRDGLMVTALVRKIDLPTIFFFLGILLTVGALEETGSLDRLGIWLEQKFGEVYVVSGIIGVVSAVVDNVPLVAGVMSMYDIAPAGSTGELALYMQDGAFWQLLALCAGTGGSILIVGSAAGVVVMGLERLTFGWYLRRFSFEVFLGYLMGIFVYDWLN